MVPFCSHPPQSGPHRDCHPTASMASVTPGVQEGGCPCDTAWSPQHPVKEGLTVNAELGAAPTLVDHNEHDGEEEAGKHGQCHGHRDLVTAQTGSGWGPTGSLLPALGD